MLSQKRNETCEKIFFTSNFQHHFKYRNKHYIAWTFGILVAQALKFIKMSTCTTLISIAFRWMTSLQSQYILCPPLACNTARIHQLSKIATSGYLKNGTVTARETASNVPDLRRISEQTIRNRLRENGLRARRPYFGTVLRLRHRRARVR